MTVANAFMFRDSAAPTEVYQCNFTFEILNAGFATSGTLGGKILENTFDPSSLDKSNVIVVALPSTINTGIEIRDRHLQRDDYFNSARYPEIRLTSEYRLGR